MGQDLLDIEYYQITQSTKGHLKKQRDSTTKKNTHRQIDQDKKRQRYKQENR